MRIFGNNFGLCAGIYSNLDLSTPKITPPLQAIRYQSMTTDFVTHSVLKGAILCVHDQGHDL